MYSDLIGIPFEFGGRGPDSFDCYGLLAFLLERDHGIEVPDFQSPTEAKYIIAKFHNQIGQWQECQVKKGAMLAFRVPGNLHVGYYIGDDKFIHAWKGSGGVTIERFSLWKQRFLGAYEYIN